MLLGLVRGLFALILGCCMILVVRLECMIFRVCGYLGFVLVFVLV